jgi:hypothetical protein
MKSRMISALATSLLVLTILTSTTGVTLAGVDDKLHPAQSHEAPGKPGATGRPAVPAEQAGSGFTYQGSLKDGNNPANGQYDLQFTLYDALTGGNQVGSPITLTNQAVTDGLFAVQLDFGASSFQGSSRWLEIAVKPAGGGSYTTLSPRQPLTAAPYAMTLVPGAVITGSLPLNAASLSSQNTGAGDGIHGLSAGGPASAGLYGESTGLNSNGVIGVANNGTNAWGVYGTSTHGFGGSFLSNDGIGVYAYSNGPAAGFFEGAGNAIYAQSTHADGIVGVSTFTNTAGVFGSDSLGYGVAGSGVTGVWGAGSTGYGVRGTTTSGMGGNFSSANGYGVYGLSTNSVAGYFTSTNSSAVEAHANNSASSVNGINTGSGIGIRGQTTTGDGVQGYSASGTGVSGISGGASAGVYGSTVSGRGTYGVSTSGEGAYGTTSAANKGGVLGENANGFGVIGNGYTGVSGIGTNGDGVRGTTTNGRGGSFASTNGIAGYFTSTNSSAVSGVVSNTAPSIVGTNNGSGVAISGQGNRGVGGYFTSVGSDAVQGHANGSNVSGVAGFNAGAGPGTYGSGTTGPGVSGVSSSGYGVSGQSASNNGVYGHSTNANGVYGESDSGVGGSFQGHAISLYAQNPDIACNSCWAGYFEYNVDVNGTLYANAKSFKIDDPLDPANKYLMHTSVESPDMLDIYRGHVVLDAQGTAWVQMPDYFQALNMDFDYQLTAIGKAQPNLYVAQEIKDNKFQIAGGAPGAKVSWQVTGVRHDPYADTYRTPVEQQKSPQEQGLYMHPELYNQPASKAISTIYQNDNTKQPQPTGTSNK